MHLEQVPSLKIEENGFEKYQSLGGVLTEDEFTQAMTKAQGLDKVDPYSLRQAQGMMNIAGIELKSGNDIRVALYDVLRLHFNPGLKHATLVDDQPIFAEVLRIVGDIPALDKFLGAYPNIFKVEK